MQKAFAIGCAGPGSICVVAVRIRWWTISPPDGWMRKKSSSMVLKSLQTQPAWPGEPGGPVIPSSPWRPGNPLGPVCPSTPIWLQWIIQALPYLVSLSPLLPVAPSTPSIPGCPGFPVKPLTPSCPGPPWSPLHPFSPGGPATISRFLRSLGMLVYIAAWRKEINVLCNYELNTNILEHSLWWPVVSLSLGIGCIYMSISRVWKLRPQKALNIDW